MGHHQRPWEEALDIDDDDDGDGGDLPFLLRPCKRQQQQHHHSISQSPLPHHQQQPDFTISQSNNLTPQTLDSYSHSQSQQQQHFLPPPSPSQSTPPPPPPTTSLPRRIPGPAGAVQAALHRRMAYKNQKKPTSSFQGGGGCEESEQEQEQEEEEDLISTQEYLRRVVEDGEDEHDDDFTGNSWACAVEFVCSNGLGDGVAIGTPLSLIKNGLNRYRAPQVVAMVKSCSPNGLGDMMVTIKDPSGTIGASINRRVLAEEEFGRNISVGAVLILKEVAVFSPSRSAHYLNITSGNILKVIPKDSGPPSKQNFSASAVKHSASGPVRAERPGMPQKAYSATWRSIEGILDEVRVSADLRTAQNDTHMRSSNEEPVSSRCSHGNQIAAVEREPLVVPRDLVKEEISEVAVREHINNNGVGVQLGKESKPWKQADGGNLLGSIQRSTSTEAYLAEFSTDADHETVMEQSQPSSLKTTIPQWTDEQLNELFDFDSDNGDSVP